MWAGSNDTALEAEVSVVESRPLDARAILQPLSGADLIIDATGEESLSIALNHHAVTHRPNFPPVLHTWIVGNGGATQALLCDGPTRLLQMSKTEPRRRATISRHPARRR